MAIANSTAVITMAVSAPAAILAFSLVVVERIGSGCWLTPGRAISNGMHAMYGACDEISTCV